MPPCPPSRPPSSTNTSRGEGAVLTRRVDVLLARSEKGQPRRPDQQPPGPVTSGHLGPPCREATGSR